MELGLDGCRVLVTGGASNIGRAIVLAFAGERARVAIADLDGDQAKRTAEAADGEIHIAVADLSDPAATAEAVADCVAALGGLDVLVNNVGWAAPAMFVDDPVERWSKAIDVNLLSTIAATRAALDVMVPARAGSIVSISSDAAFGNYRGAVYGAAKAGVISFAKSIALEHGRDGIRSNVIAPGLVLPASDEEIGDRSLWRGDKAVFDDEQVAWMKRRIPLGRLTAAADIASAVLFLSSATAARQITGQVISVSGGYRMPT